MAYQRIAALLSCVIAALFLAGEPKTKPTCCQGRQQFPRCCCQPALRHKTIPTLSHTELPAHHRCPQPPQAAVAARAGDLSLPSWVKSWQAVAGLTRGQDKHCWADGPQLQAMASTRPAGAQHSPRILFQSEHSRAKKQTKTKKKIILVFPRNDLFFPSLSLLPSSFFRGELLGCERVKS